MSDATACRIHRAAAAAAACIVVVLLGLVCAAPAARAQDIWFGAVPNITAPRGFDTDPDYPLLFSQPAEWANALARIKTFIIARRTVDFTDDATLTAQFAFLHQHQVAIALDVGVVEAHGCGQGIEGMVFGPNANLATATRMKALGADLRYVVADEPLSFGHYDSSPGACQYSIPDVAASFAREVASLRLAYPDLKVIDNEASSRITSVADADLWVTSLKAALGPGVVPVICLDIQWRTMDWRSWAPPFLAVLKLHGMRYGIIYHSPAYYTSDAKWIAAAEQFALDWEAAIPDKPRFVVIQSWSPHPTHLLPETDLRTLPAMVNTYCTSLTRFKLTCNGLH